MSNIQYWTRRDKDREELRSRIAEQENIIRRQEVTILNLDRQLGKRSAELGVRESEHREVVAGLKWEINKLRRPWWVRLRAWLISATILLLAGCNDWETGPCDVVTMQVLAPIACRDPSNEWGGWRVCYVTLPREVCIPTPP